MTGRDLETIVEARAPLITPAYEEDSITEEDIKKEEKQPEPLSYFRLFCLTVCFLGVQVGWAVQIAYTSPLFLELGVSKFLVNFVWLAGPISVIGMLLICNAKDIGTLFGGSKNMAIAIAIIGFWVLDLSNNTVQGPCRALLVDVAPPSQQNLGGSFFSFMLGTGNLAGYFLGSLNLMKWFPFMKTNLRALFTIAIIVLITCICTTVFFTKEVPLRKEDIKHTENPFKVLLRGIIKMPRGMQRICAVQFFAWFGWFTFILYITSWVGEAVYGGNPSAPEGSPAYELFNEGVRYGSLGLTIFAAVTMGCSLIYPILSRIFGIKTVFFASQLILALCLTLPVWIHSKIGAILIISACGVPWTAVMVFPFTLVAMNVNEEESGMYMGVLNIFVVIPQILVALGIGFLLRAAGGNFAIALACGGASALISAFLCFSLIVKPEGGPKTNTIISLGGH